MKHPQPYLKINLSIALSTLIWGSSYIAIDLALADYSPYSMALLRHLIASFVFLLPYKIISFKHRVRCRDYPRLLLNGVIGIGFYSLCINYGEKYVSPSITSFIVSIMPLFIIFLSVLLLGEKPNHRHISYILLSLGGLGLIAWEKRNEGGTLLGICYLLMATWAGAGFSLLQKKSLQRYHPCQVIALANWGATLSLICFLPALMGEIKEASYIATASVAYLGIFSSVIAFTTFAYALSYRSASQLSVYMYLTPIITTCLEWLQCLLLNKEAPNPSLFTLLGEGLALVGVILVEFDKRKKRR